MSNKTYDMLKAIALVFPLVITFILAIMQIWNIPYAEQIGLTLTAANALLAGIVKVANKLYIKNKKENKEN